MPYRMPHEGPFTALSNLPLRALGRRVTAIAGWKGPQNSATVEIILQLTGLLPLMVGYAIFVCDAILATLPSQSFVLAKFSLVFFLATVMAVLYWDGVLACAWIAKRICAEPDAADPREV